MKTAVIRRRPGAQSTLEQEALVSHFDVFNGDADGICALHQLRLAMPLASTLVTGVKRDIQLLERVTAQAGDSVTVLDLSLDRNQQALLDLLGRGVEVEYFDHHFSGPLPRHPGLRAHIDPAPGMCTSVLVDGYLQGRHRPWAVVGAFGDNLDGTARSLAQSCGLSPQQADRLCELGQAINYNAYGETESDLLLPPASLYQAIKRYASPLDFIAGESSPAHSLSERRRQDLALAMQVQAAFRLPAGCIYMLPDMTWARRVHGAFADHLAARSPRRAHAVYCANTHGGYTVSVRAPLARPDGADRLCRRFPAGGGRVAAAGIDDLAQEQLPQFLRDFGEVFDPERGRPPA
jgi:hypothetical protein